MTIQKMAVHRSGVFHGGRAAGMAMSGHRQRASVEVGGSGGGGGGGGGGVGRGRKAAFALLSLRQGQAADALVGFVGCWRWQF
jgi:hypothetical protein